jgi:hypothetical protein
VCDHVLASLLEKRFYPIKADILNILRILLLNYVVCTVSVENLVPLGIGLSFILRKYCFVLLCLIGLRREVRSWFARSANPPACPSFRRKSVFIATARVL